MFISSEQLKTCKFVGILLNVATMVPCRFYLLLLVILKSIIY